MMTPFAPFLLLAALAPTAASPPARPDEAAIRADVAVLASDAMRGREAGTRDFDAAAAYVAARMKAAGLSPGAGGRWRQPVRLRATTLDAAPTMVLDRDGQPTPLDLGSDFAAAPPVATGAIAIEGRLVFAGQGVVDPATGRDDFRGLDVRDAIVVMLASRPAGYPPAVAAHLGNPRRRARLAAARGARGVLLLATGPADPAAFARAAQAQWRTRRMTWLDARGRARDEGAPILGTLSPAGAARLFTGAAPPLSAVVAAEAAGEAPPTGALPGRLRFAATTRAQRLASANVVGLLRGGDPALANEYVVMTAHLDHLGILPGPGPDGGGGRIAHGVQDNAIGVALMLEVARRMHAERVLPRRSILFVALTGEEKGLLGSDYLVAHPPVPRVAIVADLNLDMPVLLAPLRDVVVHGGDRSTLGPVAAAAAAQVGLTVAPDWEPEQGRFARSDQYSFAIAGIPAIALKAGPAGDSADRQRAFAATRYHTPDDDLSHPVEWSAAPLFARLNLAILRRVADADARPAWNPGDFYGALAAGRP